MPQAKTVHNISALDAKGVAADALEQSLCRARAMVGILYSISAQLAPDARVMLPTDELAGSLGILHDLLEDAHGAMSIVISHGARE